MSALLAKDRHKVILQLRGGVTAVMGEGRLGSAGGAQRQGAPGTPGQTAFAAEGMQARLAQVMGSSGTHAPETMATPHRSPTGGLAASGGDFAPMSASSGVFMGGDADSRVSRAAPTPRQPAAERPRRSEMPPLGMDLADAVGGRLGANVMMVVLNSPAMAHGVVAGDCIIAVGGEAVDSCKSFVRLLQLATKRALVVREAQGLDHAVGVIELTLIAGHTKSTRHVTMNVRF
jgi:hypothetical protein